MNQPKPKEIASVLQSLHENQTKGKRVRALRLDRSQFNSLSGRVKVEDSIYDSVARALRRKGLYLLRFDGAYALVNAATFDAWVTPSPADVRRSVRSFSQDGTASKARAAAAPVLSPQAAWPFPVKKKPR